MKGAKILLTGGVRSGKSDHALSLADSLPGDKFFIATARPLDDEMKRRIENHRQTRGAHWTTFEEPADIAPLLEGGKTGVFVIDCLTVWTSNLLETTGDDEFMRETERLTAAVKDCEGTVIIVTNEVGLGIIPANALARKYGDRLGTLNQKMAAACDRVMMLVAGLPILIKGKE